jgi:gamma-glutamyltranspeptidase/glutathione hydrolase
VAASGLGPVFLRPDGSARAGERVAQPELARTLETIARGGRDAFYAGPIAESIARAVTNAPRGASPMTVADLAAYRVVARAPVCGVYRGWRVCSMAPPSAGGTALLQILGMLERHDMTALGRDNPLAWHAFAEATRLAMADRAAFAGDPGFVAVPTDGLLDPAYLRDRGALVRLDRRIEAVAPGAPPGTRAAIAAAPAWRRAPAIWRWRTPRGTS